MDPVVVITTPVAADAVTAAIRRISGVASVMAGEQAGNIVQLNVDLTAAPNPPPSNDAIRAMRTTVAHVPGAAARVGGTVAAQLDQKTAATRDLKVITPIILGVVTVILIAVLQALVAPMALIATVILSFLAAIGAANWLFVHVLGYPALDAQVPLLSFLFLVALGIDYNIFLTTRTKEEAAEHGTRRGIVNALAITGGVITSAGILLAAVFTVLGVLPVIVLTQIGIIVGFGVLLDTLLVRTVLLPAVIDVLGDTFWWPRRLTRPDKATARGKPLQPQNYNDLEVS